jgi:hypothetical protein
MANTASRLSANGSLTISGSYDEVTRIVPNGLILYYDAGKSYSLGYGNIVNDLSSSNNTGILVGTPSSYTSANSGYFNFDGISSYITSTNLYSSPSEFTIGVWFRTSTTGRANKLIGFGNSQYHTGVAGSTQYETGYDRQLYIGTDNKIYVGIYPGFVVSVNTSGTYTDNIWHYAVATLSGSKSNLSLYVDGNFIGSNTQVSSGQALSGYWKVGGGNLSGWPGITGVVPFYFIGAIGPAQVYNRALTAEEIQQNYNMEAARFGRTPAPYSVNKVTPNTMYISGEFDEVTYNPSSNNNVNLIQWSQDFTKTTQWSSTQGLSVTSPGVIAPDGTPTAQLLTGNGVTTGYLNASFPWIIGKNYTFSCYFKVGTRSDFTILLYGNYFGTTGINTTGCDFNLSNGVMNTFGGAIATMQDVGDGWYRCSVTAPAFITRPTGGDIGCQVIRMSAATGTIYAWGYQIEQSNSPSIYVPTGVNAIIANTFNQRTTSTGNTYIRGSYDEVYTGSLNMVTDGLTLYMDAAKLDSYSGTGTKWNDIGAGANFNATFTATPILVGGQYITFDGTYYADTGKTPAKLGMYNQPFTAMALFRVPDTSANLSNGNSGNDHMVLGTATASLQQGLHLGTRNDRFYMGFYGADQASPAIVVPNTWYLVTWVWNNTAPHYRMYVNGTLQFSGGLNTPFLGTTNLLIGSAFGGVWKSDVNMVGIYNRVLTQAEITQNYNAFRGPFGI